jgi:hypothetical protein
MFSTSTQWSHTVANTGVIGLSEDPGGLKIRRDGEVHVEVVGMEKAELGGRESSKYSMG